MKVDRGDRVKAGQVVATLESGVQRAHYELALARLEFDRQRMARSKGLYQENAISDQQVEDVRRETAVSEKEFERAAALLEQRRIRSPIDGVVVKRLLEPGEYSQPSPKCSRSCGPGCCASRPMRQRRSSSASSWGATPSSSPSAWRGSHSARSSR